MIIIYDKRYGGWLSFRKWIGRDISVVPYCGYKAYECATRFKTVGDARVAMWQWLRQSRQNGCPNYDIKKYYKGFFKLYSYFSFSPQRQ